MKVYTEIRNDGRVYAYIKKEDTDIRYYAVVKFRPSGSWYHDIDKTGTTVVPYNVCIFDTEQEALTFIRSILKEEAEAQRKQLEYEYNSIIKEIKEHTITLYE